jgi:hypothetical protein
LIRSVVLNFVTIYGQMLRLCGGGGQRGGSSAQLTSSAAAAATMLRLCGGGGQSWGRRKKEDGLAVGFVESTLSLSWRVQMGF